MTPRCLRDGYGVIWHHVEPPGALPLVLVGRAALADAVELLCDHAPHDGRAPITDHDGDGCRTCATIGALDAALKPQEEQP